MTKKLDKATPDKVELDKATHPKTNKGLTTEAETSTSLPAIRRKVEMRRFRLRRIEDESGVSGTGYVAEGVQFSDGQCVISWLTETSSIGIYHSTVELIHIHGHQGKTELIWLD